MNLRLKEAATVMLSRTPLGLWPVHVRRGVASGARWTLYPWTSYWRGTHEPAMQTVLCNLGGGNIRGWSCWDLQPPGYRHREVGGSTEGGPIVSGNDYLFTPPA